VIEESLGRYWQGTDYLYKPVHGNDGWDFIAKTMHREMESFHGFLRYRPPRTEPPLK